jgi:hypothetical protein
MTIALICLPLPFLFWLIFYAELGGRVYEMDHGQKEGSNLAFVLYRPTFYTIIAVGLIGAIWNAEAKQEWPAIALMGAAIYALLFNAWLAYSYEAYLHAKYPKNLPPNVMNYSGPSNYSGWKYAITLSLACSAIFLFIAGLATMTEALLNR